MQTVQKQEPLFCFVLSFGDLSVLEFLTLFSEKVVHYEKICERILISRLRGKPELSKLAGVYKVVYPITEIVDESSISELIHSINYLPGEKLKFSVSSYCDLPDYTRQELILKVSTTLKELGYKKFRIINKIEAKTKDIERMKIVDFVAFKKERLYLGLTKMLPKRSNYELLVHEVPHSSSEVSMPPKLARCLINISGIMHEKVLLDPFCGSGTILIEALQMGAKCIGSDISSRRIKEVRENVEYLFGCMDDRLKLYVSNVSRIAEKLHNSKIDAIVTEPILLPSFKARPNEKEAWSLLEKSRSAYLSLMKVADEVLSPGGRLVVSVPKILTLEGHGIILKIDSSDTDLVPFKPFDFNKDYPIEIPFQSTRFVRRAIYVFIKK